MQHLHATQEVPTILDTVAIFLPNRGVWYNYANNGQGLYFVIDNRLYQQIADKLNEIHKTNLVCVDFYSKDVWSLSRSHKTPEPIETNLLLDIQKKQLLLFDENTIQWKLCDCEYCLEDRQGISSTKCYLRTAFSPYEDYTMNMQLQELPVDYHKVPEDDLSVSIFFSEADTGLKHYAILYYTPDDSVKKGWGTLISYKLSETVDGQTTISQYQTQKVGRYTTMQSRLNKAFKPGKDGLLKLICKHRGIPYQLQIDILKMHRLSPVDQWFEEPILLIFEIVINEWSEDSSSVNTADNLCLEILFFNEPMGETLDMTDPENIFNSYQNSSNSSDVYIKERKANLSQLEERANGLKKKYQRLISKADSQFYNNQAKKLDLEQREQLLQVKEQRATMLEHRLQRQVKINEYLELVLQENKAEYQNRLHDLIAQEARVQSVKKNLREIDQEMTKLQVVREEAEQRLSLAEKKEREISHRQDHLQQYQQETKELLKQLHQEEMTISERMVSLHDRLHLVTQKELAMIDSKAQLRRYKLRVSKEHMAVRMKQDEQLYDHVKLRQWEQCLYNQDLELTMKDLELQAKEELLLKKEQRMTERKKQLEIYDDNLERRELQLLSGETALRLQTRELREQKEVQELRELRIETSKKVLKEREGQLHSVMNTVNGEQRRLRENQRYFREIQRNFYERNGISDEEQGDNQEDPDLKDLEDLQLSFEIIQDMLNNKVT